MKIRILETGKVCNVDGFVVKEDGFLNTYMFEEVEICEGIPEDYADFAQFNPEDILACDCDEDERWVFIYEGIENGEVICKECIAYNKDSLQVTWKSGKLNALMDVSEVCNLARATSIEEKILKTEFQDCV